MAHTLQDRYGALVDAKLRVTLVTKDNYIFNNRYEGDPAAGKVKIPVRDSETTVADYDKASGVSATSGSTTYKDLNINKDKAVNEVIDGYDAQAVPDDLIADRLDSAGYALGLSVDTDSIGILEKTTGIKICDTKTAATKTSAYKEILDAKVYLSKKGVPTDGRWLIVSPEFHALLLQDDSFIRQSDLSQELKIAGAVGQVAGFTVFESANLMSGDTTAVTNKKTSTEFIAGHPNWCHRVQAWSVEPHIQDLNGSGKYIGASAVQGRKIWGCLLSKPETVYVKRTETAVS